MLTEVKSGETEIQEENNTISIKLVIEKCIFELNFHIGLKERQAKSFIKVDTNMFSLHSSNYINLSSCRIVKQ